VELLFVVAGDWEHVVGAPCPSSGPSTSYSGIQLMRVQARAVWVLRDSVLLLPNGIAPWWIQVWVALSQVLPLLLEEVSGPLKAGLAHREVSEHRSLGLAPPQQGLVLRNLVLARPGLLVPTLRWVVSTTNLASSDKVPFSKLCNAQSFQNI
jgi:hypothetical protein